MLPRSQQPLTWILTNRGYISVLHLIVVFFSMSLLIKIDVILYQNCLILQLAWYKLGTQLL